MKHKYSAYICCHNAVSESLPRMKMHPLIGLLFYFLIFVMNPCLVPCDTFVQKIFSIIVGQEKFYSDTHFLCFVVDGQHLESSFCTQLVVLKSPTKLP